MRWFPAVGALLGAAVAVVDYGLTGWFGPEIRAAIALVLLVGLTGALHLDGLMDTCDAIFAPRTAAERLSIMSDTHVGSFAIAGAASILILKYAAILSFPPDARAIGFIAMGVLSRWSMVYATVCYPSARQEGMGHAYKTTASPRDLVLATIIALAAILPAGWLAAGYWVVAWMTATLVARYTRSKLGGLTGDVYGAISEAVEASVAIAVAPLWRLTT